MGLENRVQHIRKNRVLAQNRTVFVHERGGDKINKSLIISVQRGAGGPPKGRGGPKEISVQSGAIVY